MLCQYDSLSISYYWCSHPLSNNQTKLTAEGAGAIADALKTNKSLIEISFWHCPMGVEGAKKIAEMLEVNSTLAQLWMPGCKVGDEGACILAKSLQTNPTLSHLYLVIIIV